MRFYIQEKYADKCKELGFVLRNKKRVFCNFNFQYLYGNVDTKNIVIFYEVECDHLEEDVIPLLLKKEILPLPHLPAFEKVSVPKKAKDLCDLFLLIDLLSFFPLFPVFSKWKKNLHRDDKSVYINYGFYCRLPYEHPFLFRNRNLKKGQYIWDNVNKKIATIADITPSTGAVAVQYDRLNQGQISATDVFFLKSDIRLLLEEEDNIVFGAFLEKNYSTRVRILKRHNSIISDLKKFQMLYSV